MQHNGLLFDWFKLEGVMKNAVPQLVAHRKSKAFLCSQDGESMIHDDKNALMTFTESCSVAERNFHTFLVKSVLPAIRWKQVPWILLQFMKKITLPKHSSTWPFFLKCLCHFTKRLLVVTKDRKKGIIILCKIGHGKLSLIPDGWQHDIKENRNTHQQWKCKCFLVWLSPQTLI